MTSTDDVRPAPPKSPSRTDAVIHDSSATSGQAIATEVTAAAAAADADAADAVPALAVQADAVQADAGEANAGEATAVGVGPWPGSWPDDPRYDPDLLREGDRRNVVDAFRYWRVEAIVAELDTRRHPFHVAIENWEHDFNIGSVVRTANAFNAAGVHVVGRRRWNRRGAMVTDRYLHVEHHEDAAGLAAWAAASGLPLLGIDNLPGAVPLETAVMPRECVLVFGQEGPGLSSATRAACSQLLSIAQYGSTRSINAGAAAAIAMHTWIRAHAGTGAP